MFFGGWSIRLRWERKEDEPGGWMPFPWSPAGIPFILGAEGDRRGESLSKVSFYCRARSSSSSSSRQCLIRPEFQLFILLPAGKERKRIEDSWAQDQTLLGAQRTSSTVISVFPADKQNSNSVFSSADFGNFRPLERREIHIELSCTPKETGTWDSSVVSFCTQG